MSDAMNYRYTPEEIGQLNAEIDRLRAEIRFAKGEFQCEMHWLDRAVASDYRYRDDPALPGHRQAMDNAAKRMHAILYADEQSQRQLASREEELVQKALLASSEKVEK